MCPSVPGALRRAAPVAFSQHALPVSPLVDKEAPQPSDGAATSVSHARSLPCGLGLTEERVCRSVAAEKQETLHSALPRLLIPRRNAAARAARPRARAGWHLHRAVGTPELLGAHAAAEGTRQQARRDVVSSGDQRTHATVAARYSAPRHPKNARRGAQACQSAAERLKGSPPHVATHTCVLPRGPQPSTPARTRGA